MRLLVLPSATRLDASERVSTESTVGIERCCNMSNCTLNCACPWQRRILLTSRPWAQIPKARRAAGLWEDEMRNQCKKKVETPNWEPRRDASQPEGVERGRTAASNKGLWGQI
jgi:hypothetical protein